MKGKLGVAMALLLASACGSEDEGLYDNLPESTGEKSVTATVSREGASLELASGSRVRIPRGALEGPVDIGVRELDRNAVPPRPERGQPLEEPVAMTPHGTRFERPVRVDLPIQRTEGELEERSVRVLRLDDDQDETWEEVPASVRLVKTEGDTPRARFDIDRFSIYVVDIDSEAGSDAAEPDAGSVLVDAATPRSDAGSDAGDTGGDTGSGTGGTVGAGFPFTGTQSFSVRIVEVDDPCAHREFTGDPPQTLDLTLGSDGSFEATGESPFVPVMGTVSADGSFDATGSGTVAGTPEVSVSMMGTLTSSTFSATLSWGNNQELGDGCPIVFTLEGSASGGP